MVRWPAGDIVGGMSNESVPSEPLRAVELEIADETVDVGHVDERRVLPYFVVVLALVVVGGMADLLLDAPDTWWSFHVAFEVATVTASLTVAMVLWRSWWRAERDLRDMKATLTQTRRTLGERRAERDAWRANAELALIGFRAAVDAQFTAWELTAAEREVAYLLLQGLGHKQIAARTNRSDRTVRQHAVTVYRKSGLGGRAELAAFFLPDGSA